jgi:hypothetical protein
MADIRSQLKRHAARGGLEAHMLDTLFEAWQRAGWVPDAADVADVLLGTEDWTALLPPGDSRT